MNGRIRTILPWIWCFDVSLYAFSFPLVHCAVNRQLDVVQYAIPSLIFSLCGGLLNLKITEKKTMRLLYDRWFLQITVFDMAIWLVYFVFWMAGVFPDKWYPVAASVMHVTTVELSNAVRSELENRVFPLSEDKTEFCNACAIVSRLYNAIGCVVLMASCVKSILIGQIVLVVAMTVDNLLFLFIWRRHESGRLKCWLERHIGFMQEDCNEAACAD